VSCGCGSRRWQDADGLHLDVRGLECPQPLVEILRAIDSGEAGAAVIVHLDQEPMLLYPELDDRGWVHELIDVDAHDAGCGGGVRLCLRRLHV
jgi:hypothetical protein